MTTDREQFNTHNYKDVKWMVSDDKVVIDGIDKTLDEHAEINKKLDEVYESVPTYENPIKIVKNFEIYYDSLSEGEKDDFIFELEQRYYIDDDSDAQKGAIKLFLDNHKNEKAI